jgi:uncharacterized protein
MRLHEEFTVTEPVQAVWRFFEQPEQVASCLPGVEHVHILDEDNVLVRVTQSIGPMTATFDAKVTVLERVPAELIRFTAAGRSVRGAVGNVRTDSTVRLSAGADGTSVAVDGQMVLAGALGSVGQKVVARQAGKVTAEFAANLQRALSGAATAPAARVAVPGVTVTGGPGSGEAAAGAPLGFPPPPADRWCRVAAALSAVSVLLSAVALARQWRRPR